MSELGLAVLGGTAAIAVAVFQTDLAHPLGRSEGKALGQSGFALLLYGERRSGGCRLIPGRHRRRAQHSLPIRRADRDPSSSVP
jgi:hypothetical protein